ncbi:MAG: protein kinase domain-containing protein, partial [Planctomycetia bacterium]
ADAARTLRQVCLALAAAHLHGLVHRDLKPENILFDAEHRDPVGRADVKLVDFGLTRPPSGSDGGPQPALLSGSPAYMAPEQFVGQAFPQSDLYAVGILAYELLHGRPPFLGPPHIVAQRHFSEIPVFDPSTPPSWRRLVERLMEKNHKKRPADAAVVADWFAVLHRGDDPFAADPVDGADLPASSRARSLKPRPPVSTQSPPASGPPPSSLRRRKEPTESTPLAASHDLRLGRLTTEWLCIDAGGSAEPGFVAAGPRSVQRIDAAGHLSLPSNEFGELAGLVESPVGRPVYLQKTQAVRRDRHGRFEFVVRLPGGVQNIAFGRLPDDSDAFACIAHDRLFFHHGRDWSAPLWTRMVRSYGVRPILAFDEDGRVFFAEGPLQPRLLAAGADGTILDTVPLPGSCWDMGCCGPDVLYLQMLVDGAFGLFLYSPTKREWKRLTAPGDVTLLSAPATDRRRDESLFGVDAAGGVWRWPPGETTPIAIAKVQATGAEIRGFAVDRDVVAVLTRHKDVDWLHLRPLVGVGGV